MPDSDRYGHRDTAMVAEEWDVMATDWDYLVTSARLLSEAAHRGQVDQGGRDYILHVRAVAAALEGDPLAETVAWLHDIVEDTFVTLDMLRHLFPPEVVAAVDAITHRRNEPLDTYMDRVVANPIAMRVKMADLDSNTDPERMARLDPATRERLDVKYARCRKRIADAGTDTSRDS